MQSTRSDTPPRAQARQADRLRALLDESIDGRHAVLIRQRGGLLRCRAALAALASGNDALVATDDQARAEALVAAIRDRHAEAQGPLSASLHCASGMVPRLVHRNWPSRLACMGCSRRADCPYPRSLANTERAGVAVVPRSVVRTPAALGHWSQGRPLIVFDGGAGVLRPVARFDLEQLQRALQALQQLVVECSAVSSRDGLVRLGQQLFNEISTTSRSGVLGSGAAVDYSCADAVAHLLAVRVAWAMSALDLVRRGRTPPWNALPVLMDLATRLSRHDIIWLKRVRGDVEVPALLRPRVDCAVWLFSKTLRPSDAARLLGRERVVVADRRSLA